MLMQTDNQADRFACRARLSSVPKSKGANTKDVLAHNTVLVRFLLAIPCSQYRESICE